MFKKSLLIILSAILLIGCEQQLSPELVYNSTISIIQNQDWGSLYDSLDTYSKGQIDTKVIALATFGLPSDTNTSIGKNLSNLSRRDLFIQILDTTEAIEILNINLNDQDKILRTEKSSNKIIFTIENQLKNIQRLTFVLEDKKWKLSLDIQDKTWINHIKKYLQTQALFVPPTKKETAPKVKEIKQEEKKESSKSVPNSSIASLKYYPPDPPAYRAPKKVNIEDIIPSEIKEEKEQEPKIIHPISIARKVSKSEFHSILQNNPSQIKWVILKEGKTNILTGSLSDGAKFKFELSKENDTIDLIKLRVNDYTVIPSKEKQEEIIQRQHDTQVKKQEKILKEKKYKKQQIKILLSDITYTKSDWINGQYLDTMDIKLIIINKGNKNIQSLAGKISLYDNKNNRLISFPFAYADSIKVNSKAVQTETVEYNKFDNLMIRFKKIPVSNLKLQWSLNSIVFE